MLFLDFILLFLLINNFVKSKYNLKRHILLVLIQKLGSLLQKIHLFQSNSCNFCYYNVIIIYRESSFAIQVYLCVGVTNVQIQGDSTKSRIIKQVL